MVKAECLCLFFVCFFFFQAEDGIRDYKVTGVQTCALPIYPAVQGGLAPLVAGLLVAGLGLPLRLSGLAAGAGFLTVLYLTGNLAFEPLSEIGRASCRERV